MIVSENWVVKPRFEKMRADLYTDIRVKLVFSSEIRDLPIMRTSPNSQCISFTSKIGSAVTVTVNDVGSKSQLQSQFE